jgi:hypothetical protein
MRSFTLFLRYLDCCALKLVFEALNTSRHLASPSEEGMCLLHGIYLHRIIHCTVNMDTHHCIEWLLWSAVILMVNGEM